ncbi:MAG: LysR substrate-binding domain-containing protein, partial [Metallibacterium sp.]
MDRYAAMQLFLRVVDDGSFAAAANHSGISRAQASKLIRALEEDLGVRLIQRTTRKLSLTEAGRHYHERVATAMAALSEAAAEAGQRQTEPRGHLRVSAPTSFATRHLADALTEFLRRNPRIELELDLNDRRADLVRDGFDMAIRIGNLADSSLIARRIAPARRLAVAAPAYLKAHGTPTHPQQLESHS